MILNYYFPEKEIPKFNNCFLKIISKSIFITFENYKKCKNCIFESNEQKKQILKYFFEKRKMKQNDDICFL